MRPLQAHIWERDELDWYVEPEWCSKRLFELVKFEGTIWDPAAGTGRIVRAARAAGLDAHGTDIDARTFAPLVGLFDFKQADGLRVPNIVSNPPFVDAFEFARRALGLTTGKLALLLPWSWLASARRWEWLQGTPLIWAMPLVPRPSMPPGSALMAGQSPGGGKKDFAWLVWDHAYKGVPQVQPCMREGEPDGIQRP